MFDTPEYSSGYCGDFKKRLKTSGIIYDGGATGCFDSCSLNDVLRDLCVIINNCCDKSHLHYIADAGGTNQFSFGIDDAVRIEGTGGTSISFDPDTKKIIIDSDIGFELFTENTVTLHLFGAGTEADPLYGDVQVSQQPNNAIEILSDGLYVPNLIKNGVVYGGIVTWIAGYTYHISPAGYYINYQFYESPEVIVTLDPPDTTFDRFDSFIVDTTSTASVVTGTPSNNPAEPGLDIGLQLKLSSALVQVGTTDPGIGLDCIYLENSEWTQIIANARFNTSSISNPCQGSVDIEATNVITGDAIRYQNPGGIIDVVADYTVLTFKIKAKAGWPGAKRISFRWWNGGFSVGTAVTIGGGNYGFDRNNITTCQTVSIPISAFNLPLGGSFVNSLEISITGSGGTLPGFYLDAICLQEIEVPDPPALEDIKVKVSANDTTTGYLTEKLVAGTNVTLVELNDGGNETYQINVPDETDPVALAAQITLIAGDAITIPEAATQTLGLPPSWTINHADTSSVANLDTTGAQVIDTLTFDTYGHVQTVTTRTLTLADLGYVAPDISGQNAIHEISTNVFEWGFNPLLHDTLIPHGSYKVTHDGSRAGNLFEVINADATGSAVAGYFSSPVVAVYGTAPAGVAVLGVTQTNLGVSGSASSSGTGVQGTSVSGKAGVFTISTPSGLADNTFREIVELNRTLNGTPGNGIGSYISWKGAVSTLSSQEMGRLGFLWADVTNATRSSRFEIWGVNSGTTARKFAIAPSGQLTADFYGDGIFTGTPTYYAAWDTNGNFIEVPVPTAGIAAVTADNGLTANTTSNVQLGGNLLFNTAINTQTFRLSVNTATAGVNPLAVNATTGTGIAVTTTSGTAVYGTSSSGMAVYGISSSYTGVTGQSLTSYGGRFVSSATGTNNITPTIEIQRGGNGTSADGFGTSIDFNLETSPGFGGSVSTQLVSKWTTAATASRTSQFEVWNSNSGVIERKLAVAGNGKVTMDTYGDGIHTGTTTYIAGWDTNGVLIEIDPGTLGGGGGGLTNAYATMSDGTNTSGASGGDTFKFRTANAYIDLLVTNNDVTHGDNLLITFSEEALDDRIATLLVAGNAIDITYNDAAGTITIDHEDTSTVANQTFAGAEVVDVINFDTYGHVTTISKRTLTLEDLGYVAPSDINIYEDNGTLTANRTVTMDSKYLEFVQATNEILTILGTTERVVVGNTASSAIGKMLVQGVAGDTWRGFDIGMHLRMPDDGNYWLLFTNEASDTVDPAELIGTIHYLGNGGDYWIEAKKVVSAVHHTTEIGLDPGQKMITISAIGGMSGGTIYLKSTDSGTNNGNILFGNAYLSTRNDGTSTTNRFLGVDASGYMRSYSIDVDALGIPAEYTNEMAQDAVASMLDVSNGLTGTYNDAGNTYSIVFGGDLTADTYVDGAYDMFWGYNTPLTSMQTTVEDYYKIQTGDVPNFSLFEMFAGSIAIQGTAAFSLSGASGTISATNGILLQSSTGYLSLTAGSYVSMNSAEFVSNQAWDSGYRLLVLNMSNKHVKVAEWLDLNSFVLDTDIITITESTGIQITGTASQNFGSAPSWTVAADPDYVHNPLKRTEVRFKIGSVGAPLLAGETTFILEDCSGNPVTGKKIIFIRERQEQWLDDDYTYNSTTGEIVLTNPALADQRFLFRIYPTSIWTDCSYVNAPTSGFFKINSTDYLKINSTDKIEL
jgi:hypothetical protein